MKTYYMIVDRETGEPVSDPPKLYSAPGPAKAAYTCNEFDKFAKVVVEVNLEIGIVGLAPGQEIDRQVFDKLVAERENTLNAIRMSDHYKDDAAGFKYWYASHIDLIERFGGANAYDRIKYV